MEYNLIVNNMIFFTPLCQDWRVGSGGLSCFQDMDTKLDGILAKNQHTLRDFFILSIDVQCTVLHIFVQFGLFKR